MRPIRLRRPRGLTLIETLVTVAILGLLIVVFILMLRPNPDRRCRLEAERFAAYLISAEAEAEMRDGPVRVAVDFSAQAAQRELVKIGADLGSQTWFVDEKSDRFRVNKPVELTIVETPIAGEAKAGTAWIMFNGHRTPGAVAVFQFEDAIYSVVVYPRGAGNIEVKKGRAKLGEPPEFKRAPKTLPGLPFVPSGGGRSAGNFNPDGVDPEGSPPVDNPPDDEVLDSGLPPDLDDGIPPPPTPDAGIPPDPPPIDASVADAEPDAGELECENDSECKDTLGEWAVCHRKPGPPVSAKCVVDLSGRTFRVRTVSVQEPDGVAPFVQSGLNQRIGSQQFNLLVHFDTSVAPGREPGLDKQYLAWVIQATPAGIEDGLQVFAPNSELPTFGSDATPSGNCATGFPNCMSVVSMTGESRGETSLFLPRPSGSYLQGDCAYRKLTVIAELTVSLNPQAAGQAIGDVAHISLAGAITRKMAKELEVSLSSSNASNLFELLESANQEPDADTNGDGSRDGWAFSFVGSAQEVRLHAFANPSALRNRVPPNCESD